LLSHIGLLSLVVGYCIMGAFIFRELEYRNELEVKRNMTNNRLQVTKDLWEITRKMDVLEQKNWTDDVTSRLKRFEKGIIIALKDKGWDGKESNETVTWTFPGGLFYSITVITTIGYGHIAPKTAWAKVVTIFYAILGIPLTVLCWSNIGDAMANAFRFCYWRICCYVCTKKPRKKKKRHLSKGGSRAMSVRNPSSRSRSIRRSIRTQRSEDTISNSLNSYSISDPERFYEDGDRARNSKRSVPKSLHIPSQYPETEITPQKLQEQQQSLDGSNQNKEEKVGQDKPEKKPSTAARFARSIGMKRNEKETKLQNGDTAGRNTQTSPAIMPHHAGTIHQPASINTNNPVGGNVRIATTTTTLQVNKNSPISGIAQPLPINTGGAFQQNTTSTIVSNVVQNTATTILPPGQQTPVSRLDRVPEDEWMSIMDYDDYTSEDEVEDYSTKPVPIWLSICLVIGYIIGGAKLFQEWEGWSLLDSSYFCFITLTTIGFGDLTPDNQTPDGEIRIALCSLYLLFGIAMICMSFNLVQEEVINNVKGMAMQLGIIKDDDEEEE